MFNFFKVNEQAFLNELLKDELDINKIQKYIQKGIDLNKQDDKGKTILNILVAKRKVDSIRLLLKYNINLDNEDIYGKTVLDEAIDRTDGMMIRFLLESGASINKLKKSNRTILQDVAFEGKYKVFELLIKYKPDFDVKDSYGKTILFDAVAGGNIEILKEVVNNISTLNTFDQNHQTVLFEAVFKKDKEIAKILIQNGINVNLVDNSGQNVLFNTVILGIENLEILELLIKKGINVNIVDNDNKTILDEILYLIGLKNTKVLLDGKYKYVNSDREYFKITTLLIENGLEIDTLDSESKTTLYKEIENHNFINAKFLIQCGANINITDEEGDNILSKEVLKGYSNYQIIDFLMDNGADIEHRDLDEKSVIDRIVDIILIQKGLKPMETIYEGKIKAEGKYDLLLKKLLSYKPNLDIQRLDGKSLLFDLVQLNDFDTLKQIINYGIDLNIKDKKGNTPLSFMVEQGLKFTDKRQRDLFLERLVFLLKFRVNVDSQDEDGRTVFHKAVIADDLTVVEKLLTKKADLSLKDKHGRTALHHTQWNGNFKIARWLIAAGADMNIPDNSGFTLLNYAAIFGHLQLVTTLIASGVFMYNRNPKSKKVAKFFKERESNLQKLLANNITDTKMKQAIEEVVENLRNEINDALRG